MAVAPYNGQQVTDPAQLTRVDCRNMTSLDGIERLMELPALTELAIIDSPALTELAPLARLADHPALTRLVLLSVPGVTDLTPLAELDNITYLDYSGTDAAEGGGSSLKGSSLADISPLAEMRGLRDLGE